MIPKKAMAHRLNLLLRSTVVGGVVKLVHSTIRDSNEAY